MAKIFFLLAFLTMMGFPPNGDDRANLQNDFTTGHDTVEQTVATAAYVPLETNTAPISIPVLYYHSVAVEPGNNVVLHPDKFVEQIEYLAKENYHALTLEDFILIMEHKMPAPEKPMLLTFDDGYADNYETVMPILQKHGFPATLFVSTGLIGQQGYLSWKQIKEMSDSGWDIQPHGVTHSRIAQLTKEQQQQEIVESRRQIEEKLGTTADIYCYPYGEYNKATLELLKQSGFRYAFTIDQGKAEPTQDPYLLKRIYISGSDGMRQFKQKLN